MNERLDNDFLEHFRGRFQGIMRWEQLDALWSALRERAGAGWYVYAVGEAPPSRPVDAEQLSIFIGEMDTLLRREHTEEYCGIVYVDDPAAPTFIKIFDPNNLGVVCGYSDNPPLPGWVLSTIPPADLEGALTPPASRRRWWQRLFSATR
jgi:hypothetical protein